ncbi:MAG: diguanylate cyclase [Longicatena sp.]
MPWKLSKGEVYCSTSIGIACYPEDGNDPEELICVADQAMYKVKKSGGAGIQFHEDIKKQ